MVRRCWHLRAKSNLVSRLRAPILRECAEAKAGPHDLRAAPSHERREGLCFAWHEATKFRLGRLRDVPSTQPQRCDVGGGLQTKPAWLFGLHLGTLAGQRRGPLTPEQAFQTVHLSLGPKLERLRHRLHFRLRGFDDSHEPPPWDFRMHAQGSKARLSRTLHWRPRSRGLLDARWLA